MSKFNKHWPTVIADDDGNHVLITPSGEIIQGTIETVVSDTVDDFPTVKVTFFCNIAKDSIDAGKKYKEASKA